MRFAFDAGALEVVAMVNARWRWTESGEGRRGGDE